MTPQRQLQQFILSYWYDYKRFRTVAAAITRDFGTTELILSQFQIFYCTRQKLNPVPGSNIEEIVKTGQNQVLYRFSVLFILLLKTPQPVFTSPGAS
jgi:hypothetical protein